MMDSLPPEIRDEIAQYLHDDGPAWLAMVTVSRTWQVTIEKLTFAELYLRSTDLDLFELIVDRVSRRRGNLRTLYFTVVLPSYTDEERRLFETTKTGQRTTSPSVLPSVAYLAYYSTGRKTATAREPAPWTLSRATCTPPLTIRSCVASYRNGRRG